MTGRRLCISIVLIWFLTVAGYAQSDISPSGLSGNVIKNNTATLRAESSNAYGYQWYKNGVKIEGAVKQSYVTNTEGLYSVVTFNEEGCPSEISDLILVSFPANVAPTADLQVTKTSESRQVSTGDPYEYTIHVKNNGSGDAFNIAVTDVLPADLVMENAPPILAGTVLYDFATHTITWKLDQLKNGESADLKLTAKSLKTGLIENTATVEFKDDPDLTNNSSTDRKEILSVRVPNVFTPNGDNMNDTFVIEGLETYQENDIVILNRWGNHVYQKKNYQNDWTAEGLNEGTYFYVLTLKTLSGKQQILKGYVTLLRTKK